MIAETGDTALVAAAVAASGDVAYDWDLTTDAIVWSAGAEAMFGLPGSEAAPDGAVLAQRINPEDMAGRQRALAQHYAAGGVLDCEYRLRQATGAFCWVHDRGQAVFDEAGRPVRLVGVLRLIDRRKAYEAELIHRINFDELTGHYNRNRLREALDRAMILSERYGAGGYLAVGIDNLSLINDAHGYAIADAVLVSAGEMIERTLRASDVIGRVGGDIYGVVLSRCPDGEIRHPAEKIIRLFRETPVRTQAGPIPITVSIGGIAFPGAATSAADAMAGAESALGEAKTRGRDCFVAYTPSAEQRRERRSDLEVAARVKAALKADRLAFAFQPVVRAADGATAFHEALVRIVEPEGAVLPAGAFVPVVERMGMMRMIDRHMLELAVAELERHPAVALSVNISGLTASDRSWLRTLTALLRGREDVARRLIVEITETAAIEDLEETARFVATVRELGAQVALDDFGAGYTSLRHLKALAVDIVKIDGSFIRDIAQSPDNLLFVRTLMHFARGVGLTTVAECVETEEDAAMLRREGVDLLQGYHFGRPAMAPPWRAVESATAGG